MNEVKSISAKLATVFRKTGVYQPKEIKAVIRSFDSKYYNFEIPTGADGGILKIDVDIDKAKNKGFYDVKSASGRETWRVVYNADDKLFLFHRYYIDTDMELINGEAVNTSKRIPSDYWQYAVKESALVMERYREKVKTTRKSA